MGGMVDAAARMQIEQLLARYAHAIDNDALENWPKPNGAQSKN